MEKLGVNLVNVGLGIGILLVVLIVGYFVFSKLTRYNDSEEIAKGNEAAGMYMGDKVCSGCVLLWEWCLSRRMHGWICRCGQE